MSMSMRWLPIDARRVWVVEGGRSESMVGTEETKHETLFYGSIITVGVKR